MMLQQSPECKAKITQSLLENSPLGRLPGIEQAEFISQQEAGNLYKISVLPSELEDLEPEMDFQSIQELDYLHALTKTPDALFFIPEEFPFASYYLLWAQMIRPDEKDTWLAYFDMLKASVQTAASAVEGFYGLQILDTGWPEAMRHFDLSSFTIILIQQARKLGVGERTGLRYCGLTAMLHKRIPERFGKIELKHPVMSYTQEFAKLDLFVGKMNRALPVDAPGIVLIEDLSRDPIFKFGMESQTERLQKLLAKYSDENPPRCLFFSRPLA